MSSKLLSLRTIVCLVVALLIAAPVFAAETKAPVSKASDVKAPAGKATETKAPRQKGEAKAAERRPAIVSPEVQPDRSVIFRLQMPNAKEVALQLGEFAQGNVAMEKSENGVWSVKVGPMPPEVYAYSFVIDGTRISDPSNGNHKTLMVNNTSFVIVPGEKPMDFEEQKVPHGYVIQHLYDSNVTNTTRRMFIYLPPGYLTDTNKKYPVLYLFHGAGDNESTWSMIGRTNVMMDNWIASGKAVPMVVVMTNGALTAPAAPAAEKGAPATEKGAPAAEKGAPTTTPRRGFSGELMAKEIIESVMPAVEKTYRVYTDPAHRAVCGLSMGGRQSSEVGLKNTDKFPWIGVFSGATNAAPELVANPEQINKNVKLLYVSCGDKDGLVGTSYKEFTDLLDQNKIKYEKEIFTGGHTWMVFRNSLRAFVPKIFKE